VTPFRKLAASIAAVIMLGAVGFAVTAAETGDGGPITVMFAADSKHAPGSAAVPHGEHDDDSNGTLAKLGDEVERELLQRDARKPWRERSAPPAPPAAERPASVLSLGAALDKSSDRPERQDSFFRYKADGAATAAPDPRALPGAYFKPAEELKKVEMDRLATNAAPGKDENRRMLQEKGEADGKAKSGFAGPRKEQAAGQGGGAGAAAQQPQQTEEPQLKRKIIRSGEVEFEIGSFDTAVATVSKIAEEEQGYIGTVNSEKLPNGKVRGTVVVRVPPDRLDTLLLKLRALGELKSQRIGSQDVTKAYYDLESRLRAARTMEERLLKIIREGKGEIKDLLQAEKELGEWRTKIEGFEGELRYYNALISLSTLTVTLYEKEIKAPAGVVETERVNAGLEVEDVEKAHKDVLFAVTDAKGRVTKSEIRQLAAGQFTATVHFEVAPDASGPMRDRLRQIGTLARLEVDRIQQNEGGTGSATGVSVRRKDSVFLLSIYNLANVQPRETVIANLACADAEASYKAILARVEKAGGRVLSSTLNRQKNDQTTGTLVFEVKSAAAAAVLADVRLAGEVMRLDLNENADAQNVTRAKRGYQVQLFAMGLVSPRESTAVAMAARDVAAAHKALEEAARKSKSRILQSFLNEQDRQNVNATLDVEIRRDDEAAFLAAMRSAGQILNRSSRRAEDQERVVDSKVRYTLSLQSLAALPVRETYTMTLEVRKVNEAVEALEGEVAQAGGRVSDSRHTRESSRQMSRLVLEVPLAKARLFSEKVRALSPDGIRVFEVGRNPGAPEGELAMAKLVVTLSNQPALVTPESGPWARILQGLSFSATALSWSLSLVVIGLCFVVPIGLVGWGAMRIARRMKKA
jgi:hypothetical protein